MHAQDINYAYTYMLTRGRDVWNKPVIEKVFADALI